MALRSHGVRSHGGSDGPQRLFLGPKRSHFSDRLLLRLMRDELAVVAGPETEGKALSPKGVVAISMMNDGKSRAIWRVLRQEFRWIDGILWQQKEPWPPPTG
jgi:hypothetical protein